MKLVSTSQFSRAVVSPPVRPLCGRPMPAIQRWARRRAADLWLNLMFFHSRRFPWIVRKCKPFWMWGAWTHSHYLQDNTRANARRLLGEGASAEQCDTLARAVVSNFFDFISDVGRSIGQTREELLARIESIEGERAFHAARRQGRGAIVLSAHMGSFEVGMAALLQHEKRVHVLFRRDSFGLFEKTRSDLRRQLGVIEQCVDDGLPVWVRLREALARDEVVLIQGDRVMPGQKGQRAKVLGGHMVLPTGPARLASASGAPIIPVFSTRQQDGRIRLYIEEPIEVSAEEGTDPAMNRIGAVLEKYLRLHPDQWLMIHRAWCEDAETEPSDVDRTIASTSSGHARVA